MYVLLADDHPEAAILALGDREVVHTALTAAEVLSALAVIIPDVVLLDLGMTDDDDDFVLRVRALYPGRLVVASGVDPCKIHRVCSLVGAYPLPKPYLACDLMRAIRGESP